MTLQTHAVIAALQARQHATNVQLLADVTRQFPDISATTVHRITKRLVEDKVIGQLRSPLDGSAMLDANPKPHYHFACQPCGAVRDITLPLEVLQGIERAVGEDILKDSLVINGVTSACPLRHS